MSGGTQRIVTAILVFSRRIGDCNLSGVHCPIKIFRTGADARRQAPRAFIPGKTSGFQRARKGSASKFLTIDVHPPQQVFGPTWPGELKFQKSFSHEWREDKEPYSIFARVP